MTSPKRSKAKLMTYIGLKQTRTPSLGVTGLKDITKFRELSIPYYSLKEVKKPGWMDPQWNMPHFAIPGPLVNEFNRDALTGYGTDAVKQYLKQWDRYTDELRVIKAKDETHIAAILARHSIDDSFFLRSPLPHQKAGLAFWLISYELGAGHINIFDEMRTGKTKQACDIARWCLDRKLVDAVLIIVPATIRRGWYNEIALDVPAFFSRWTTIVQGTKVQRAGKWQALQKFYIINYETARVDKELMYEWGVRHHNYLLICDESHKLKNPDSQQSKAILALKPRYSIFMTGTPVANRPEDIWAMANFVCPGVLGRNIWSFRDRWGIKGGFKGKQIIGYKNLEEVQKRLGQVSLRRLRKEITFDQMTYSNFYGQMEGDQLKAYQELEELLWTELCQDGEWTSVRVRSAATKVIRLQQITSGFLSPNTAENVWFDKNWKLDVLDEFIEDYIQDEKLVIWSRFIPPIEKLTERYHEHGAVMIKGSMKAGEAMENIYRFQNDPGCKIIVGNILCGQGFGLNPATVAIFYDKWWSPTPNNQARDRIVGIKNPVPTSIITMVTERGIDEHIEKLLSAKRNWGREITGDEAIGEAFLDTFSKEDLMFLVKGVRNNDRA